MAPKDESELRDMLYTAVKYGKGPIALRYPRGEGYGVAMSDSFTQLEIGKGERMREGRDVAVVAASPAAAAASVI